MIWGVFPMEPGISWEGHLLGLAVGVIVAIAFRKKGPVPPKYRYEIEEELGIEPPDLEGEWLERRKRWEEQQKLHLENKRKQEQGESNSDKDETKIQVTYHYKKKDDDTKNE